MVDNDDKIHIDDFAEKIAHENGITKVQAKEFITTLFDFIGEKLADNEPVKIYNFGSLSKKWMKKRKGINPKTQEKISIPAHYKIFFKPYSKLSDIVNRKYRNLKPNVLDALLTLTGMTKVNPDFINAINNDTDKKNMWEKAKKRALIIIAIILLVLLATLATLITIPIVMVNENNKIVQYVNSINKIFGLDKITDRFKGEINEQEANEFFISAKTKLTDNRKIIGEYVVKDGDNIFNIAKAHWENEYLWPDLYITNKEKIKDPDLIKKDDVLVIYEKLGDPKDFSKKQKDDIVYAYLGIYRIYKALGEAELLKGNKIKGEQRINDSKWTLYTAVRYDHNLLNKYEDAIYPEDREFVQQQIDKIGFIPPKKDK